MVLSASELRVLLEAMACKYGSPPAMSRDVAYLQAKLSVLLEVAVQKEQRGLGKTA